MTWLEVLSTMIEAECPRETLLAIAHDARNLVDACVRALREGHFPRFRDAAVPSDFAPWFEAAQRVSAWCDELGDAEYGHSAIKLALGVAERRRKAAEAQEATR